MNKSIWQSVNNINRESKCYRGLSEVDDKRNQSSKVKEIKDISIK